MAPLQLVRDNSGVLAVFALLARLRACPGSDSVLRPPARRFFRALPGTHARRTAEISTALP